MAGREFTDELRVMYTTENSESMRSIQEVYNGFGILYTSDSFYQCGF